MTTVIKFVERLPIRFTTNLAAGVEGLREKLDAEIVRSLIAQENVAIVQTEIERHEGDDALPSLPERVTSAFIKATPYEKFELNVAGSEECSDDDGSGSNPFQASLSSFRLLLRSIRLFSVKNEKRDRGWPIFISKNVQNTPDANRSKIIAISGLFL